MVSLEQIASMFTLGVPTTVEIRDIVKALPLDQQAAYARLHAPAFFPFDADSDTFQLSSDNRSLATLVGKGLDWIGTYADSIKAEKDEMHSEVRVAHILNFGTPTPDVTSKLFGVAGDKEILAPEVKGFFTDAVSDVSGDVEKRYASRIVQLQSGGGQFWGVHVIQLHQEDLPPDLFLGYAAYVLQGNSVEAVSLTPGELLAAFAHHASVDTALRSGLEELEEHSLLSKAKGAEAGASVQEIGKAVARTGRTVTSALSQVHSTYDPHHTKANIGVLCQGKPMPITAYNLPNVKISEYNLIKLIGAWQHNLALLGNGLASMPHDPSLVYGRDKHGRLFQLTDYDGKLASLRLPQSEVDARKQVADLYAASRKLVLMGAHQKDSSERHLFQELGRCLPAGLDPAYHEELRGGINLRVLTTNARKELVERRRCLPAGHMVSWILERTNDRGIESEVHAADDRQEVVDLGEVAIAAPYYGFLVSSGFDGQAAQLGDLLKNQYGHQIGFLTMKVAQPKAEPVLSGLHGETRMTAPTISPFANLTGYDFLEKMAGVRK